MSYLSIGPKTDNGGIWLYFFESVRAIFLSSLFAKASSFFLTTREKFSFSVFDNGSPLSFFSTISFCFS